MDIILILNKWPVRQLIKNIALLWLTGCVTSYCYLTHVTRREISRFPADPSYRSIEPDINEI